MDEIFPTDGLELLDIKNNRELKRFYSKWSVNASKLIQQYAKEQSLTWYNTAWRKKSKEIPFFIRTKAPRSFLGSVFFGSRPVNYVFGKSISKMKIAKVKFPKKFKISPVKGTKGWFTPKSYKPDITDISSPITDTGGPARYFLSKTSHEKTRKYKRPLLWYQNLATKEVGPVTLTDQMADKLYGDPETFEIITKAFQMTVHPDD